jgi:uridine phosphorylase
VLPPGAQADTLDAMPARPILVCFALKEEAAPFRKIARAKSGVTILLTGIGRQNAEKSVREFLDWGARASGAHQQASRLLKNARIETIHTAPETGALSELVLTCGFAGGLNPNLKLGDVVFELANVPLAPSLSPLGGERVSARTGEGLSSKLLAVGAKPVKFFCADRIAVTAAEKNKLREETGADAVEMESAAIHAICAKRGIPCVTVRVISDTANEDLPLDFNQLSQPDKSLDYGKLLLAVAKSPGKTGGLLRLQKNCRYAAERLAEVLAQIVFS